jgi:hypothetical protein
MRHRLVHAVAGFALAAGLASTALAAGPSLGTATSLDAARLTYTTSVTGNTTTLPARAPAGAEGRRLQISGKYGIPRVTFNGDVEGLSRDGRLLVLQTTDFGEPLRARSGFVTVDTRKLAVKRRINLRGDFAYDALSPDGRTLYLIEHFSNTDVLRYRVRAFDLKTGRLLPRVIVDKREPDEPMSGVPSARVSSADGRRVFTLYVSQEHPFVHLLDTVARVAFCIDLPHTTDMQAIETASMKLTNGGARLTIFGTAGAGARHVIDVKTLKVS